MLSMCFDYLFQYVNFPDHNSYEHIWIRTLRNMRPGLETASEGSGEGSQGAKLGERLLLLIREIMAAIRQHHWLLFPTLQPSQNLLFLDESCPFHTCTLTHTHTHTLSLSAFLLNTLISVYMKMRSWEREPIFKHTHSLTGVGLFTARVCFRIINNCPRSAWQLSCAQPKLPHSEAK